MVRSMHISLPARQKREQGNPKKAAQCPETRPETPKLYGLKFFMSSIKHVRSVEQRSPGPPAECREKWLSFYCICLAVKVSKLMRVIKPSNLNFEQALSNRSRRAPQPGKKESPRKAPEHPPQDTHTHTVTHVRTMCWAITVARGTVHITEERKYERKRARKKLPNN